MEVFFRSIDFPHTLGIIHAQMMQPFQTHCLALPRALRTIIFVHLSLCHALLILRRTSYLVSAYDVDLEPGKPPVSNLFPRSNSITPRPAVRRVALITISILLLRVYRIAPAVHTIFHAPSSSCHLPIQYSSLQIPAKLLLHVDLTMSFSHTTPCSISRISSVAYLQDAQGLGDF